MRAEVLPGRGVHAFLVHDAAGIEAVNDARLKLWCGVSSGVIRNQKWEPHYKEESWEIFGTMSAKHAANGPI